MAESNGDVAATKLADDAPGAIETVRNSLLGLWTDFLAHLPYFVAGLAVLVVTWIVASVVGVLLRRTIRGKRFKRGFADLVRQLIAVLIWTTGLTVAAIVIFPGLTPAKALAGLGIGSIALGFAFKDVVENFLAGVLILWKFPFDPGDYVRCGDVEGQVEEITVRMTLIRRTTGELVVLPNATLFKEPVDVLTAGPIRRISIVCGVAYGEDVDASREVIRAAVKTCPTVSDARPVEIFAREFADSSVNFEIAWWCGSTPLEERASRDDVVAATKRALDEAGIEIPFPYRTLTFKEPVRLAERTPKSE